jgi:DNA-binding CsgD family transcriptional regulator
MKISDIMKILHPVFQSQQNLYGKDVSTSDFSKNTYVNHFSYSDNSIKLVFNHVTNKVIFISDTAEMLGGYQIDQFYKLNLIQLLKILTIEHYDFAHRWWQWAYDTHIKYPLGLKTKQTLCGVKFVHKEGHIVRVMIRQVGLRADEKGLTTVSALTFDDVTHLMKDDFYWIRMDTVNKENQFHHLMSTEKNGKQTDILSDREKEILRLLAQGKESKEIGQLLYLSPHTISNHRQNMMNKIGVKDTTGLIQICRMVGII